MMLTAAAVIVGSAVILFDPIFQGLAISLMAGEVASLFLSRMTVPILFYMSERKKHERPPVEPLIPPPESPEGTDVPSVEPVASFVESVPVVESAADSEPALGNEQRPEGEHNPTPETVPVSQKQAGI
ncbi:MAG TPA: hypothetical protein DCK99_19390 [Blastocatellia bacterium]|nr:hypothetical protein [Blastocatellia bacterium]